MSMSKPRISAKSKTVWHRNPISGHEWSTEEPQNGFEVSGCFFSLTSHTTEKRAEKEAAFREAFNAKFPWKCPVSQREVDRCQRLGLTIDWDKYELVA